MLKIIYCIIIYKREKKRKYFIEKQKIFFQKFEIYGNYMSQIFFKKQKSTIKDYCILTTFQNYIK